MDGVFDNAFHRLTPYYPGGESLLRAGRFGDAGPVGLARRSGLVGSVGLRSHMRAVARLEPLT